MKKTDPLKSDNFIAKKKAFFDDRLCIRKKNRAECQQCVDTWIQQAIACDVFVNQQTYWYELLQRKSSKDGLLFLGFEFGECVELSNPLLYAPSLRTKAKMELFLKQLLNQIFEQSAGEKKH